MPRSQVRALLSQRSAPKTGLGNGDLINCQEPTRGSDDGGTFGAIPDCITLPEVVCPLSPMAESTNTGSIPGGGT